MAELLDRAFQLRLLQALADEYPSHVDSHVMCLTMPDVANGVFKVNSYYLLEHGLLEGRVDRVKSDPWPIISDMRISVSGLDFLAEDGGLTAILGVQTIRFADQEIRDAIVSLVQNSDAEPSVKNNLVRTVRDLPAEGLKAVFNRMIEGGLNATPELIARTLQALSQS